MAVTVAKRRLAGRYHCVIYEAQVVVVVVVAVIVVVVCLWDADLPLTAGPDCCRRGPAAVVGPNDKRVFIILTPAVRMDQFVHHSSGGEGGARRGGQNGERTMPPHNQNQKLSPWPKTRERAPFPLVVASHIVVVVVVSHLVVRWLAACVDQ